MTSHPRSVSLWILRICATLWLVQLLAQVVLGGAFVSGDTSIFKLHSINGSMMNTFPFILLVTAIVHATVGRGRVGWIAVSVALLALAGVQEVLGYARIVGAHIVGGATLLTVATVVTIALWRHPYRPRARRTRSRTADAPAGAEVTA